MDSILKKILIEKEHQEVKNETDYYSKDEKSFFFLLELTQSELESINRKDSLQKIESFKKLLGAFKNILDKGGPAALEKNSSLLIYVKCDTIDSLSGFQQQILLLEEDEYFFKKYVILFTENSIKGLQANEPIVPILRDKIRNDSDFGSLANKGYTENISEYLVIVQLFIKLPFLGLSFNLEDYKTLEQRISEVLSDESEVFRAFLELKDEIEQLDFLNQDEENHINEIMQRLSL